MMGAGEWTDTGIGKEWAVFAKGWLGYSDGKHCHWCEHMVSEEGTVECGNPDSKFFDGDRIRTWDGRGCAVNCECFSLDAWYRDDSNLKRRIRKATP